MGYNKMVAYANVVELYEYEKPLPKRDIFERSVNRHTRDKALVATSASNSVKYFKRKDSAGRATMVFRRLVAANLVGDEKPILFTFTYAENQKDIRKGYLDFNSYNKTLRYQFGKNYKYICVPEFQKRGAVHFHALYWGLPKETVTAERSTRFFARLWGHGYIYITETDGNVKLSSYLAKYMAKSFVDKRLKNQKSFISSRNVLRPIYQGGFDSVDIVLDNYLTVDNTTVQDRTFSTQWLGRGRYRKFECS